MVSMTSNGGSIENGGTATYGSGTSSGDTKVSSKKMSRDYSHIIWSTAIPEAIAMGNI